MNSSCIHSIDYIINKAKKKQNEFSLILKKVTYILRHFIHTYLALNLAKRIIAK